MPSAKTLPLQMREAARTMSSGLTWLSVPIWSSAPHRPQFFSLAVASRIACFPTLRSIAPDPPGPSVKVRVRRLAWAAKILYGGNMDFKAACVVGWPVEHSRSPLIHNDWIRQFGLLAEYRREAVPPDRFADFVAHLAEHGYVGGNVTVPHKEAALALSRPDAL